MADYLIKDCQETEQEYKLQNVENFLNQVEYTK